MRSPWLVRRLLEHPRLQPLWWRWLKTVPEPLRCAERRARTSFLLWQLPLATLLALVHVTARYFGAFESRSLLAAWLAGTALAVLAWPVSWFRLGVEAIRAARSAPAQMSSQLRAFAVLAYLLAMSGLASLAIVFGLLVAASVP